MPNDLKYIYWDACVPLAYINKIEDRIQHIEPMMQRSGTDFQIITSVLSITEVAFAKIEQDRKTLDPETEKVIGLLWQAGSPIKLVEFYELIAIRAQRLIRASVERGWSLKPADAIHLATADQLKVQQFHTYDDKLSKYSEITDTKFPIDRPISDTPHLGLAVPAETEIGNNVIAAAPPEPEG